MEETLTAVFENIPQSEGGGYVAYVVGLPGAISEGDTLQEARENLHDAITLLLQVSHL
jgi:predicted RNase H-like HicB family nuclease